MSHPIITTTHSPPPAVNLTNLNAQFIALQQEFAHYKAYTDANNDAFFLCIAATIIFLMQCGFAFLEAGAVRSKNTVNIIVKNFTDSLFCIIAYWAVGWGLAYGPTQIPILRNFIGFGEFFLSQNFSNYPKFFHQYIFAATSATIVGGAIAERCQFQAYLIYCLIICGVVYPPLTHMAWDSGWMKQGFETNDGLRTTYLDFAGGGVVHICGGIIALAATYIIGPRLHRFNADGSESLELRGHSVPFAALGGFILMFGFLAFNGCSTGAISPEGTGNTVALAMINTLMAGSFAALTCLLICYLQKGKLTLLLSLNACLAGMVSACAGCDNSAVWTSSINGSLAAIAYLSLSNIVIRFKIDDPLDAFAVHFGGGSIGLLTTPWLRYDGIFYSIIHGDAHVGHAFLQFLWQIVCILAIIAWSLALMVPVFLILKRIGCLRIPEEVEVKGMDIKMHGEAAYPLHAYGHGWDDFEPIRTVKKISIASPELSLEELASAYEGRTNPGNEDGARKKSVYHNPMNYEHPEFHSQARTKKYTAKPKRNTVTPE